MLSFLAPLKIRTREIFLFDADHLVGLADRNRETYATADPFPHVVLDNFLPEDVASSVLREFPGPKAANWLDWRVRDPIHQPKKQGIGSAERLKGASPYIQQVLMAFN